MPTSFERISLHHLEKVFFALGEIGQDWVVKFFCFMKEAGARSTILPDFRERDMQRLLVEDAAQVIAKRLIVNDSSVMLYGPKDLERLYTSREDIGWPKSANGDCNDFNDRYFLQRQSLSFLFVQPIISFHKPGDYDSLNNLFSDFLKFAKEKGREPWLVLTNDDWVKEFFCRCYEPEAIQTWLTKVLLRELQMDVEQRLKLLNFLVLDPHDDLAELRENSLKVELSLKTRLDFEGNLIRTWAKKATEELFAGGKYEAG